jgi:hypothetical protein
VAFWWPPLRRCPAEAPAGEGPGDAPRRGGEGMEGRGGGGRCVWFINMGGTKEDIRGSLGIFLSKIPKLPLYLFCTSHM